MSQNSPSIRLQKLIADCGITSRRKAEELILKGRVTVNGSVVTVLGTKVDPSVDTVLCDGHLVDMQAVEKVYLVMNKPRAYVTTLNDPEGRPTIMEFCKDIPERIYPVGRLDYLSEGLLILTNDGEVANWVMHPRYNINKVYEVKVFGQVTEPIIQKLRAGVQLEEGFVKPKTVRVLQILPNKTWLEFRLGEGKNREIRRICEHCGLTVDKLRRVAIEGLSIEGIPVGKYAVVTRKKLLDALGMNMDGSKKNVEREYTSPKRTIRAVQTKPSVLKKALAADDKSFYKYRKEHYYRTLETFKEFPREEEAANAQRSKNGRRKRRRVFGVKPVVEPQTVSKA